MTPRWEFRVFGDDLAAGREALSRIAVAGDEDARTDVYFVVDGRTDASLKLREDRLDLKLLRERDGLERWEPVGEAGFPVATETLRDRLLGPAGVRLDLPAGPIARDVLLALAGAARGVHLATVGKRRRNYRLGQASAEFTRLRVDGRAVETIAVEEADRDGAGRAVAALGLASRRNTSYQRFLVETVFALDRGAAKRLPPQR